MATHRAEPRLTGYRRSLVELLAELRAVAGMPSFREIAARIPSGSGANTSHGYLNEIFAGRRVPSGDMAATIVEALGGNRTARDRARRYAEEAASDRSIQAAAPAVSPAAVPRQLPRVVAHFTGREADLAVLRRMAAAPPARAGGAATVVTIVGPAGVGKTTLALRWAHAMEALYSDGQLYVNLRGFDPSGPPSRPDDVLYDFLHCLDVPPWRIPDSLDARSGLYRSLLADRRMLVVLDNARDGAQVRPLLPAGSDCLVVITSRDRLSGLVSIDGVRRLRLNELDATGSHAVLAARIGRRRLAKEIDAVAHVIDACGGLPLALAIVAGRYAAEPHTRLAILAEQLRTPIPLDALADPDALANVRAVLSWSYRSLAPDAQWVFRLLGAHPGPDIAPTALASMAAIPRDRATSLLDHLAALHLASEHRSGRYALHDLVRTYAIELTADDDPTAIRDARRRGLDHYLHTAAAASVKLEPTAVVEPPVASPGTLVEPFATRSAAYQWFTVEHDVLLAMTGLAVNTGHYEQAACIPTACAIYLDRGGYWDDYLALCRYSLQAAERLGDGLLLARAHGGTARACIQLAHFEDAYRHLHQALQLYHQINRDSGVARTLLGLARASASHGRFIDALDYAEQALAVYRRIDKRDGQADALNAVGWHHMQLEHFDEGLTHCRRALDIHRTLGPTAGEADVWDSIGYGHHHQGDYARAVACFKQSLRIRRRYTNRYFHADTLTHLADSLSVCGRTAAARRVWQQALDILDELRHRDAEAVRGRLSETDG